MAAARTKAPAIGSSQWIQNEREHAEEFVAQEEEEFGFSVKNEMDWLNEHMADIFSTSQVNFADMFKTPGKLRGKTPRTARNQNPLAPRQPLTDIFAPNAQPAPASAQKTSFYGKVAQIQNMNDAENQAPTDYKPVSRAASPQRVGKSYTDSGYHGMMTEDEAELGALSQTQPWTQPDTLALSPRVSEPQKVPLREDQPPPQRLRDAKGDDTGASDDSFVSAREQESQGSENVAALDEEMTDAPPAVADTDAMDEDVRDEVYAPSAEESVQQPFVSAFKETEPDHDVDMDMDADTPHSDASSPEKPLNRKSSFTFSSLPAREPLGAKKSMGQIENHRSSVFSKSINKNGQVDAEDDEMMLDKPVEAKLQNKSSTQLLHERLNMLGKTKEARSSKSIPQSVPASSYPQLPEAEPTKSQATEAFEYPERTTSKAAVSFEDDDDDWIAPSKSVQTASLDTEMAQVETITSPARPLMHQKSMSTTVVPSTMTEMAGGSFRHQKGFSVSNPNLAEALDSTTPAGSPANKKQNDGPLSASKSRLWSAFKSAKNIFASSASTSAAAKLEAHNAPASHRSPKRDSGDAKMFNMPGALYSQNTLMHSPTRNGSVISFSPSRKTRNSAESEKRREKELKAQQKAADELEKAREKERQKAAKQLADENAKAEKAHKVEAARLEKERRQAEKQAEKKQAAAPAERPESAGSEKVSESEMLPPPTSKTGMLPAGKLRAPGRLARPAREPAHSKPVPVSVRVASQAQRMGQSTTAASSFSKSQHENSAPVPAQKDSVRASSAFGNRPGSAAPGNARLKALEAAARKKEADERAAQRKADQKKEMERKRAEKLEQEKRAEEERKAAEHQRIQDAKIAIQRKAAEKQAAEARKRENERLEQQRREHERQLDQHRRELERIEQQRREAELYRQNEEARKTREAHELADAIRRERAQQAQHGRGDVPGTLRQLTKNTVPAMPAKPVKRTLPVDDDELSHQPQRPGILRGPPSYQQADAKRRRTNEEQDEPNQRTSVMAPPKRPSTMRKETMSKYSGYTHAPPPAAHHSSMFKSNTTAQHQMHKPTHPSQLIQTSNARIPFGETSNQPAPYNPNASQTHSGYENVPPSKFKTPARPATAPKSAKTTPHYPQGDNIELPDIATDSEDESDDDDAGGFRAPSWVASPALRDLLTQQQLVDPETVFGPIGELKMDEVFKNNKNQDRLKRFRDRGSSALWVETGDAVTSAEKRKDMEMRERVVRDGGWRYEPGA